MLKLRQRNLAAIQALQALIQDADRRPFRESWDREAGTLPPVQAEGIGKDPAGGEGEREDCGGGDREAEQQADEEEPVG